MLFFRGEFVSMHVVPLEESVPVVPGTALVDLCAVRICSQGKQAYVSFFCSHLSIILSQKVIFE